MIIPASTRPSQRRECTPEHSGSVYNMPTFCLVGLMCQLGWAMVLEGKSNIAPDAPRNVLSHKTNVQGGERNQAGQPPKQGPCPVGQRSKWNRG